MRSVSFQSIKTLWLLLKRSGWRRSFYRIQRRLRLKFINPRLGTRLYPFPNFNGQIQSPLTPQQSDLLIQLVHLRQYSQAYETWQIDEKTIQLLNQPPISLEIPVQWQHNPSFDPLWLFQLHGWEWAWPHLADKNAHEPLLALWHDWLITVPVGSGLAWEPYPTSRRLVVWSTAWWLTAVSECDATASKKYLAAIAQHADYLCHHLERDLDNNHLIANYKAIAWAGMLFPQLEDAHKWCEIGLQGLWQTLLAQVGDDGGHNENSTGYHMAVWLDGLETALLAQSSGKSVPTDIWQLLEKMGEWALALRRPDGRLPLFNDAIEDEPVPLTNIFELAAKKFNRADFDWAAGDNTVTKPKLSSKTLADTRYVVFRNKNIYLAFDAGGLGPDHCPGHGHADALSFELWHDDQALIIDPGTYQYPSGEWRDYFRGTAVHSTVTVDKQNQSQYVGPFRVTHMAKTKLIKAEFPRNGCEIVAEHDGYTRLADPVRHQRSIQWSTTEGVITDKLFGKTEHHLAIIFHLAPCVVDVKEKQVICTYPNRLRLQFLFVNEKLGTWQIEEGWSSRHWYQKERSPVLKYNLNQTLPVKLIIQLKVLTK